MEHTIPTIEVHNRIWWCTNISDDCWSLKIVKEIDNLAKYTNIWADYWNWKIQKEINSLLPEQEYVWMWQRKKITEVSDWVLVTDWVANCKAIVLVFKNNDTWELLYTLEHSEPNSQPNCRDIEWHTLIEWHWFDWPSKCLREYMREQENRDFFRDRVPKSNDNVITVEKIDDSWLFKFTVYYCLCHTKTKKSNCSFIILSLAHLLFSI